jgi:hypothetical protein
MRWAGYKARVGRSRLACGVLVGKPEGKRPLGRSRRRLEITMKMNVQEIK